MSYILDFDDLLVFTATPPQTSGLTDTLSLSESLGKQVNRSLSDSLSLTETLTTVVSRARDLADSLSLSESLTLVRGKGLTDSLSLTETLVKQDQKILADSLPLSEGLGINTKSLSDTLPLSETLVKFFSHCGSDPITVGSWTKAASAAGSWFSPPRLNLTPWQRLGSCSCGASGLAPHAQGCNENMAMAEPTGLTPDALSLTESLSTSLTHSAPTVPSTGAYFLDGFEDNSSLSNWYGSVGGSTPTYSTSTRGSTLTGGTCIKTTLASDGVIKKSVSNFGSVLYFRVYFKIDDVVATANGVDIPFLGFSNGGIGIAGFFIRVSAGPTFKISYRAINHAVTITSTALSTGTWYRVEGEITNTGAGENHILTADLYLGDSTSSLESMSDSGTNGVGIGTMDLGPSSSPGGNDFHIYLDDVGLNSTERLGPGGIWMATPNSDSSVGWTPLSGTNFSNVDDLPGSVDDDTTYNSASTAGLIDRFGFTYTSPAPPSTSAVVHTDVNSRFKLQSGGGATVRDMMGYAGVNYFGGGRSATGSYVFQTNVSTAGHFFASWNNIPVSVFNSLATFGYELQVSTGTTRNTCSVMNVDVRAP